MKKYFYDEAVKYLEQNGIGCDPCEDLEGEYVCDLLDDEYDGCDNATDEVYYYEKTLQYIIKRTQNYINELKEDD